MKVLIIGGNGFVGRRLAVALDVNRDVQLHVLNRHGAVSGAARAQLHRGDRNDLVASGVDRDWDAVVDFVCFDDRQAAAASVYFTGVRRYIFISSQSVYDLRGGLTEADFDPLAVDLAEPDAADPASAYQEGKRRAEAALARAPFPAVFVRFPFLLGPDDYSRRLEFHIERVAAGLPIAIPNPAARISMIQAADACAFLEFALGHNFAGPVNAASPDPVMLGDFIGMVETAVGKTALLDDEGGPESASPYAPPDDYFMSTALSLRLGFETPAIADWLPDLVRRKAAERSR